MSNFYVETKHFYKGYPFIVGLYNKGHRCGYVGIAPDKPFYNTNYDNILVHCHGGLTFGDQDSRWDKIAGVENYYWIGFDCAHYCDGIDLNAVKEYFGEETADIVKSTTFLFPEKLTYKPVSNEECCEDCKNIIDELLESE